MLFVGRKSRFGKKDTEFGFESAKIEILKTSKYRSLQAVGRGDMIPRREDGAKTRDLGVI